MIESHSAMHDTRLCCAAMLLAGLLTRPPATRAEDWPQLQRDAARTGYPHKPDILDHRRRDARGFPRPVQPPPPPTVTPPPAGLADS